jgi:hypothetical protein
MIMQVSVDGKGVLDFAKMWPRTFVVGDAEGYCGDRLMVTVSRPFSAEEDAVFDWVLDQDRVALVGIMHLADGRDLMLLERRHKTQSLAEAVEEHRVHIRKILTDIGLLTPAS